MLKSRSLVKCALLLAPLAMSSCSSDGKPTPSHVASPPPPPAAAPLPFSVGDGVGSENGNYGAQTDGEMRGPRGEHCVVFNWDRPLNAQQALRLRSASCDSAEYPGLMTAIELGRTIIPLSQSNLLQDDHAAP